MKKIIALISALLIIVTVPLSASAVSVQSFGSLVGSSCENSGLTGADSSLCSDDGKNETVNKYLKNIINFLLMVVGVLAVIMIIISAIKFATSAGDSGKLTTAKNTLIYSVIGLAVAIASFWIINFVLDQVTPKQAPTTNGTTGGPTVNRPV